MMGPEDDLPTLLHRQDHLNVLRFIRAHKLREPHIVVTHGKVLLGFSDDGTSSSSSASQRLGNAERLAVLEQLCIASFDLGNIQLAESCIASFQAGSENSLVSKDSSRFRKLLGMYLEAKGDFVHACKIYDALLKENPSNGYASKRKYCILAAQPGKEIEAFHALNDYLTKQPGDIAAWNQMADACLGFSDFKRAAYCYEEVLLGCPIDSNIHMKLGEVYSTIGGLEHSRLARKHLAQAVQLDCNNLRAWYGLIASSEAYLEEVERATKVKREIEEEGIEVAKKLILVGGENLMEFYKGTKMRKIVEQLLKESSELL